MLIAMLFIWQYQNNEFGIDKVMFRISVVSAMFSSVYLIISFLIKETVAKSVVISKDNLPFLYYVSMVTIFLLCMVSIGGVVYFYGK